MASAADEQSALSARQRVSVRELSDAGGLGPPGICRTSLKGDARPHRAIERHSIPIAYSRELIGDSSLGAYFLTVVFLSRFAFGDSAAQLIQWDELLRLAVFDRKLVRVFSRAKFGSIPLGRIEPQTPECWISGIPCRFKTALEDIVRLSLASVCISSGKFWSVCKPAINCSGAWQLIFFADLMQRVAFGQKFKNGLGEFLRE